MNRHELSSAGVPVGVPGSAGCPGGRMGTVLFCLVDGDVRQPDHGGRHDGGQVDRVWVRVDDGRAGGGWRDGLAKRLRLSGMGQGGMGQGGTSVGGQARRAGDFVAPNPTGQAQNFVGAAQAQGAGGNMGMGGGSLGPGMQMGTAGRGANAGMQFGAARRRPRSSARGSRWASRIPRPTRRPSVRRWGSG